MLIKIELTDIHFNHPTGRALGLTTKDGKTIYIQRGLGKKKSLEVLVHELTHASMILLDIKRSHYNHERIARQVGRYALHTVWKRRHHGKA